MTELSPGNGPSAAYAMNSRGQIVGTAVGTNPVVWERGKMRYLDDRRGSGLPLEINAKGDVMGYFGDRDGASRAALWRDGKLYDLNIITAGVSAAVTFTHAYDINDAGQIVVIGGRRPRTQAYLLSPVRKR